MLPEIIQIRTFIVISVRIRQDDDNSVPEYSEERTANSSSNENSIHEEEAAEEVNSCLQLFSGFCEPHFLSSVLNPNEVLFPVTWRKTLWWLGTTTVLGGCIATEVLTSAFSTAANYNNFILMCMLYGVDPVIQTIAILSAKYPVQNKPREIKLTDEAVFRSNQDVAVVIPTHLAADKIEATLRSCLRHVNPEQIFIVDNGNSDFPMDDTPNIVRKMNPKINYIWGKFGNKTFAQYIGTLLANYKYIFTMDDDMRLPENFSFGTKLFNEKVKAVSYPIVAVHSQPLKSNLLVRWQSLEYKLSDCAKLSQARFGGVLYPHGAASMWERDTFLKILKRHDAIFFAEDVKLGMILKELGFSMGIAAGTCLETEVPVSFFGDAPNFYQQRVRSWEMGRQVYFHKFLWQFLMVPPPIKTPIAGFFFKLAELYSVYSNIVDWCRFPLFLLMLLNEDYWIRFAIILFASNLPVLLWNYFKLPLNKRFDLQSSFLTILTFPLFKLIESAMSVGGIARLVAIYGPNYKHKPNVLEFEEMIVKDRQGLEQNIRKEREHWQNTQTPPPDFTYNTALYGRFFNPIEPLVEVREDPDDVRRQSIDDFVSIADFESFASENQSLRDSGEYDNALNEIVWTV